MSFSSTLDPEPIHDIPLTEPGSEDHALIRLPVECRILHVFPAHEVQIASGPLALLKPVPLRSSGGEPADSASDILVILQVGLATFPIHRHTPFGTTTDCPFSYLFKPDLPGAPSSTGYIKLKLPSRPIDAFPAVLQPGQATPCLPTEPEPGEPAPPELVELRDSFEQVLIEHEILESQNVMIAAADELSRALIETSRSIFSRWRSKPVPEESKVGEEGASGRLSSYSRQLVSTLDRWSIRVTKQLSPRLPPVSLKDPNERAGQQPSNGLNLGVVSETGSAVKDGLISRTGDQETVGKGVGDGGNRNPVGMEGAFVVE